MEGREGEQPAGNLEQGAEQIPDEGQADEAVGDTVLARGTSAKASAPRPRKSSAGGSVGPRSEHLGQRNVGALGRGARPGEQAGDKGYRRRRCRGEQQAPGKPAAPPDGKREQRLEPLLGLFARTDEICMQQKTLTASRKKMNEKPSQPDGVTTDSAPSFSSWRARARRSRPGSRRPR